MKAAILSVLLAGIVSAADYPEAEISNGILKIKLYLPDADHGFYRATRFDWSGVIYSLKYEGHEYYGPWFQSVDPAVHDFIYKGDGIVSSSCTAMTGPADEFAQLGWEEAKTGGTFVKIGVGVLRKPDKLNYDQFRVYEIVDPGKWTVKKSADSVLFAQNVADAYEYAKTVRLVSGKPEMRLEHRLRNTGTRAIRTRVYNHNFLVLDGKPPGPGLVITVPFNIQGSRFPDKRLAEVRGNQIIYLQTLKDKDIVQMPLAGFGGSAKDDDIRIENSALGAGMRITGDRPLESEALWSIRAVMAMEPFVSISVEPGQEFSWTSTYEYYKLPAGAK